IVLDPDLPGDIDELLDTLQQRDDLRDIPLVIYHNAQMNPDDRGRFEPRARAFVPRDDQAHLRLVEETALLLHRRSESIPQEKRVIMDRARADEASLKGKRVLI